MARPSKRRFSFVAEENDKDGEFVQYDADAIEDDSSGSNVSGAAYNSVERQFAIKLKELEPQQNGNPFNCFTLVDFSDEVLYEIFKHLDSWTILALMNSAARFVNLLLDKRFWHDIDLSQKPLPLGILEDVLVRSNEGTHTIKVCGPPSGQHVAGEFKRFTTTLTSIFPKLRSTLRVLELEGVSLDFSFIHITDFPASLKKLALKDCSVKIPDDVKSIFHTMDSHLKDLDELEIEDCDWFEPYYIMAISKLPILRKLSLKGCKLLTKFVPYGSMAARFGFHRLEILDLRFTPINNADLQCFGAIDSLRQLLLDCPQEKPKETEPSNETQLLADASKNSKASAMKENSSEGNDQQENVDTESIPKNVDLPSGSRVYGNAPAPSIRISARVFDEDNTPSTSKSKIVKVLYRGTKKITPQFSERTVDYDNMPSTSSGARSMLKRLGGSSSPEAQNNGVAAKKAKKLEDTDSDTDSEVQTSKPTPNGVEDEERYSSSSPPISLSDSVKVNTSCFSCDSDSDVGAIEERGDDDGNDDDDDDGDGDDASETPRCNNPRRGIPDVDDTETRSTVSLSDAARESSPTTSRSSTHSEASNQSVVVLRVNPNDANASVPTAGPSGQVNTPLRNPNAFVITAQQDRTIEDVLAHMEQIRSNLRNYNQRRIARHRPYQIICMNPQNPTEPLYLMQPQNQNHRPYVCHHRSNHFEQVLGHPMFWNLMDPLNTQASRRHRYPPTIQVSSIQVTDRAMYSFGRAPNPVEPGVIWIRNNNRPHNNRLERIELRNYRQITDLTLQHLVQVSPNLVFIDVSGTGVTRAGIRSFRERMPECEVIATHITDIKDSQNDDQSKTQSTSAATTSVEPAQAQPQPQPQPEANPEERNEQQQCRRIAAPIQINIGNNDDDDDDDDDDVDAIYPISDVLPMHLPVVNGEILNNVLAESPEVAVVEIPPDESMAEPPFRGTL